MTATPQTLFIGGQVFDGKGGLLPNHGVLVEGQRVARVAPAGEFSTNLLWNRAIAAKRLYGTRLDGVWIHVGTPEARDEAEAYLAKLPQ